MDYRERVIDELRHYNELMAAERICRDRLSELNADMRSMKMPSPKATPVQGGGSRTEERWLCLLQAKDDEIERLRSVKRRLRRLDTAWEVLGDRDKAVLTEWYIDGRWGAADRISNREHCSQATAYRWRDEATIRIARAYFGAVVT